MLHSSSNGIFEPHENLCQCLIFNLQFNGMARNLQCYKVMLCKPFQQKISSVKVFDLILLQFL